jgi:hypothetical protein
MNMHLPSLHKRFYIELFKNSVTEVTASDTALALNQACCFLRDYGVVPLDQWVPYVHFGGTVFPEQWIER